MCGRFTQKTGPAELAAAFDLAEPPPDLGVRYNIAPSLAVLVVPNEPGPRLAVPMRWGLVPHWARDPGIGNQLANGRAESAADKPSFRQALRRRRGLLLMDGFFEWKTEGRKKLPYLFTQPDDAPFAVAALWERWSPPAQDGTQPPDLVTVCLLTTDPCPTVADVHDRMPVILGRQDWDRWLTPDPVQPNDLQDLLVPWQGALLARPVSRYVNDAAHEGPECVAPAEESRVMTLF